MNRFLCSLAAIFQMLCLMVCVVRAAPAAYFDPATLDPRTILAPPPAANADSVEKELEIILQMQADRTQPQLDRINREVHYSVYVFSDTAGDWFGKETIGSLPMAAALLERTMMTTRPITVAAKIEWNRQRPFMINSRVYPPIERPTDSSYPSAHAVQAFLDAYVLAELAPDETQALLARAQQVGDDRVAAGVEFPSDVAAGRKLAQAIFSRLTANQEFRDDLKAAKEEVAAARKTVR